MIAHCSELSRSVELLKGLGVVSEFLPTKSCQQDPSPQDNAGFEQDARFAPYRSESRLG